MNENNNRNEYLRRCLACMRGRECLGGLRFQPIAVSGERVCAAEDVGWAAAKAAGCVWSAPGPGPCWALAGVVCCVARAPTALQRDHGGHAAESGGVTARNLPYWHFGFVDVQARCGQLSASLPSLHGVGASAAVRFTGPAPNPNDRNFPVRAPSVLSSASQPGRPHPLPRPPDSAPPAPPQPAQCHRPSAAPPPSPQALPAVLR